MKSVIAKTNLYSIEIDTAKNRAYLIFIGFCRGPEEIPNLLNDVKKACQGLRRGFTLLTDASQMKVSPQEVVEIQQKSQQIWIEGGLSKTAEVMSENIVVRLALDRCSTTTGMAKKNFNTLKDAEAWLDLTP